MRQRLFKVSFSAFLVIMILGCSVKYMAGHAKVASNVSGRELPIYSVDTPEKKAALTFDAAWGNESMQKLLEILAKYKIHATFFTTGGWVEKYPEDVKAILAAGHDLGNHSETHPNMSQLSEAEQEAEIMGVHDKVKKLTGYDMQLFRAPYGDYNDTVIRTAAKCGYYAIQWDVDSLDWKDLPAGEITQRVVSRVQPGSIVLFHNAALHTPEALPAILETLLQEGYTFVPISELILPGEYNVDYTIDHTGRQLPAQPSSSPR